MSVHKWRKAVSAAVICSLLAGGAAYAEPEDGSAAWAVTEERETDLTGENAATTDGISDPEGERSASDGVSGSISNDAGQPFEAAVGFSDVPDNHWAKKHITKLNLQGIVQGYEGKFRPGDSVTQQEAVLMALRYIGAEEKADTTSPVVFPDSFIVSNYFKPYVMQAIYEGLIDENEEFRLAEADPDTAWGTKPATREWVTKLVIRMIGEEDEARRRALDLPKFADSSLIGDAYTGYVNAAVELRIVQGVSADRFDPKGIVSRAQMATMLSRAQATYPIAASGHISGVMTAVSGTELTLADENGVQTTFTITPDTAVYRYDSESPSAVSELKPFTSAIVFASGREALYVEQMDDVERLEKVSGVIVSIDLIERLIYVKTGTPVVPIPFDAAAAVLERNGNATDLSALDEGIEADFYRETFSREKRVVRIELASAPVNKEGKGKIVSIQPGSISILDEGAEQPELWAVAAAPVISKQGKPASLSDLLSGDIVTYVVQNGAVTALTVESAAVRTVTGLFDSFSSDRKSLIYAADGRKHVSELAPGAVLEIPGFAVATWDDLYKDDRIELTIDGSERITKVKVTDRNIATLASAVIIDYYENDKALTVKAGDEYYTFRLTDSTRIDMNGNSVSIEAVKPLLVRDRKVMVTYSDKQAITLRFVFQYTGKLTALNAAASRIVIELDDGTTAELPYHAPSVHIPGAASATLSDLKPGDFVTLQLDHQSDRVVSIQVHKVVQMTVASVDAANRKLRLTSPEGVTSDYVITSDTQLLDENGQSISLSQVVAGRTVNTTFSGSKIIRLQTIVVKTGRVVSIAPGTVAIAEYGGPVTDVALGSNFKVVKNGVTSTSTASLAVNDRVDIRINEAGERVVTVIPGVQKTLWRYDAAAKVIHVRKTTLNELNQFKLDSDTVITADGSVIDVSSLKPDDKIVLYIHGGKLLEVERI